MNFNLHNLLRSGYTFTSSEYELETKYVITNSVLWFVIVAHLTQLIVYSGASNIDLAKINILAIVVSVCAFVMGHIVSKGNYNKLVYLVTMSFMVVIFYGYYLMPTSLPTAGWTLILIIASFLVTNIYIGIIVTLIFIVAMSTINYVVFSHDSLEYTFMHVLPVILGIGLVYMFEKKFSSTIKLLEESNKLLEMRVKSRTKALEEEKDSLNYQAHYDDLTALPNRAKFHKEIHYWIDKAKNEKSKFALFFIDLDRFKRVNDSFGHSVGDIVLKTVSTRVLTIIDDDMFFARISGDEFTLLLKYNDKNIVAPIAKTLLQVIKEPIIIEENKLYISASIGISFYPENSVYYADLIKYADTTMFEAKRMGKGIYKFYAEEMTHRVEEKVFMEAEIHTALDNDEFVLYYQPQIDMRTDTVIGVEVLIRWNHPKLGLSTADTFIPLAEDTGVIIMLDYYILKKGMNQVVEWKKKNLNIPRVSFNFSTKHLHEKGFVEVIEALLLETGCKGEWIELEITESHIMSNIENAIVVLKTLRALGIKIAIDDFGTGYSSLTYLKRLPADTLKIDKSFIENIPKNKVDMTITKAIINIGNSLGLIVIAEGVETQAQKEYLMANGCHYLQGYLYYEAMSSHDIEKTILV